MSRYEYKIVPAPNRGLKGKGIKGPEARFANALEGKMNALASEGWEYQRAETLPSVERSGLTSTTTEWRNVLVFRRLRDSAAEAFAPELLPAPEEAEEPVAATPDEPAAPAKPEAKDEPEPPVFASTKAKSEGGDDKPAAPSDNGVEDTGDVDGISASLNQLAKTRNTAKSEA